MSEWTALPRRRLLIPRWRSFKISRARELTVTRKEPYPLLGLDVEVSKRKVAWDQDQNLITAAELVESALVSGLYNEGANAAKAILEHFDDARPVLRKQALTLLIRSGDAGSLSYDTLSGARSSATSQRRLLAENVRDPIAWTELALQQLISGSSKNARRSIMVATQLAPDNRFVLRRACRLLVQQSDPETALDLLRKSIALRYDPWLMSAEISVAQAADRPPLSTRIGQDIIDSRSHLPLSISELASALGSLEIGGKGKKVKKLIQISLEDPTGNAVAQASWVAGQIGLDILGSMRRPDLLTSDQEAMAYRAFELRKLELALNHGEEWAAEEEYSPLPSVFCAHVANFLGDYSNALIRCTKALRIDPTNVAALMSSAFCLGRLGRVDESERNTNLFLSLNSSARVQSFGLANRGLVAFLRGQNDEAKKLYRAAISGFSNDNDRRTAISAEWFMAESACEVGDPECLNLLRATCQRLKVFSPSPIYKETINALRERSISRGQKDVVDLIDSMDLALTATGLVEQKRGGVWFVSDMDGNPISTVRKLPR